MYLSQLDLHGFKSFANKTSVKFDSGITAIVGPNGCGKSNIVDALRWVLGEQRASLLRSSAMQNVIFNGTATKKALGMAEVSVRIENNLGILPLEFSEVIITRRLYRSGESEYLLNNSVCRLKDIVDLFMDTGMGPGAYSVIELKMVEEILNDKNNDRLRLFEEAAGVTRYKEKRKHTLRKLDETMADMVRVEDILVEIRKKVRSLQLQAKKAQRAKEYSDQLLHLDLAWNRFEYERIQQELQPLNESLVKAEKEKKDLQQELSGLEQEESIAREKLVEKESALTEAQRQVNQLAAKIRETDTTIRINQEKKKNEQQVILNFEADITQAENDITEQKRRKAIAENTLKERNEALNHAAEELEKHRLTWKEVDVQVSELRRKVGNLVKEQESINKQLTEVRSTKIRLESRCESAEEDLTRLQKQRDDLDEQLFISGKDLELLADNLQKLKDRREDAEIELQEVRDARKSLERTINDTKDSHRELLSRLDSLTAERDLLEQIAHSHDAFPGSVQYLLQFKQEFGLLDVVTNLLSSQTDVAVALEAALGEACNFLVVDHEADAQIAFKKLKDAGKGRAAIIPLDFLESIQPVVHKDSLAHQVKCDAQFDNLKNILLSSVCLVDGISDGLNRVKKESVTCVTTDGDVISNSGVIRSGSKQKNIGIRVGLKDRINGLSEQISQTETKISETQHELSSLRKKQETLSEESANQQLKEAESAYRKAEQQRNTIASQRNMFERNMKEIKEREQHIAKQTETAREELQSLIPEMDHFNSRLEEIIEDQLTYRSKLRDQEAQLQRCQQSMNDARVNEQRLRSEADGYKREMEQSETGISMIKERLDQRAEQAKRSREVIRTLTTQTEELEISVEEYQALKQQSNVALDEAEESAQRHRGRIRAIEENLRQVQRKREVNTELLHQLEIKQSKLDMQSKILLDYVWETYGKMIEQIEETFDDETDPNAAKSTIANLKERLKSIGEVNHLAIQEYEEEQERLEFYEKQINDLYEAEQKLRETISEINKTANERFSSTFSKIRENFKRVFSMLFQEDDFCDLLLKDKSDDPLDNKVEIIAKPRGKRPSNIEQLSGGEKTLTAIALLFAIYLVKPSPFCILDEVDAPLDDANVERFTGLIRQFSSDTQFIVITHNKKTMDKSEVMYGVTMQETGVSRLVGVRLGTADVQKVEN